jgi:hypothetical protein
MPYQFLPFQHLEIFDLQPLDLVTERAETMDARLAKDEDKVSEHLN